jgi:hypothetical protein
MIFLNLVFDFHVFTTFAVPDGSWEILELNKFFNLKK